ncbi:MAG: ATP-binding protein [Sulfuricellaceae bacterium]|nr:ATP-binding protein [Sulfuricellaceae bacterium]
MADNIIQLQPGGAILQLTNIAIAERAVARLKNRGPLDPGLAVLCGPSGFGKSISAAWVKARHPSYYVQADDFWTKKTMLVAMSRAMGLLYYRGRGENKREYWPEINVMADAIKSQLETSRRILIVDEFDYCVDKNLVEAVRSLYEGSKAAVLIIGEEALPHKLKQWERFHGRILDWFLAEPVNLADARELARAKCAGVTVADDMLEHLVKLSKGSVRRVSNNLGRIYDEAADQGWESVTRAAWGSRTLQDGEPPRRGNHAA